MEDVAKPVEDVAKPVEDTAKPLEDAAPPTENNATVTDDNTTASDDPLTTETDEEVPVVPVITYYGNVAPPPRSNDVNELLIPSIMINIGFALRRYQNVNIPLPSWMR